MPSQYTISEIISDILVTTLLNNTSGTKKKKKTDVSQLEGGRKLEGDKDISMGKFFGRNIGRYYKMYKNLRRYYIETVLYTIW